MWQFLQDLQIILVLDTVPVYVDSYSMYHNGPGVNLTQKEQWVLDTSATDAKLGTMQKVGAVLYTWKYLIR